MAMEAAFVIWSIVGLNTVSQMQVHGRSGMSLSKVKVTVVKVVMDDSPGCSSEKISVIFWDTQGRAPRRMKFQ